METGFRNWDAVLSPSQVNDMEDRRVQKLNEAGIDEEVIIDAATMNFNNWNGYFNENIVRGKADVDFTFRDQWNVVERSEFMRVAKPALMMNKLYDIVKKVVAENRKYRSDLMVRSINGKASQQEITLRANLLRTIAYQSQNELVYQTAFKSAVSLGFGAFQIMVDFESARSFNKIIKYGLITDPTTCSWDPTATKPHKGDGNFCSRSFVLTRNEFFATYPYITNPTSWIDPFMLLDYQSQTRDLIVIQDYYLKEWFPLIIYKLSNGMEVDSGEWEDMQKQFALRKQLARDSIVVGGIILNEIPKIVAERQSQDFHIMHYRLLRDQIIDFARWNSKHLPIPFVDGDSFYIEGRQYTKSLVHEAKDAQKSLNYAKSEIVAEMKNRRREQWIGTPDNIKGYEQMWRNPEAQIGILLGQPDPKTGLMPQKQPAWEISPGLLENAQAFHQDIQEIVGFSENENLQGRDVSGTARRERKMEGAMSAYVFYDNMRQAIQQGGRVVNDLLKFVIGNDERDMSIAKRDGNTESITMNKKANDGTMSNTLTDSEFDVEIDAGPSSSVQKEIALEFFQQTVGMSDKPGFSLVADLWCENLDMEQAQQMKERYKTMVPPEILAKEEGQPPPPPKPPSPQDQLAQAEIQEKMSKVQAAQAKANYDQQQLQLDQARLELDKKELILKAREMDATINQDKLDHLLDIHQTQLAHEGKLAETMVKVHNHAKGLDSQERIANARDRA